MDIHRNQLQTVSDFLRTQHQLEHLDVPTLSSARSRSELGISSLGIIVAVVNYMDERGLDSTCFDPMWIERLEDVEGIVSVFEEIGRMEPRLNLETVAASSPSTGMEDV